MTETTRAGDIQREREMAKETTVCRMELLNKVSSIVNRHTTNPIDDLRATGKALVQIADALDWYSPQEARSILSAMRIMYGID